MKDLLLFFLIFICFLSCNDNEDNATQPVTTNNPLVSKMDSLVHENVLTYMKKKGTTGLSIGILQNGQTNFYGYGETQEGNGKIPNENTIFEIGSISKTFTASAVALWANARGISLNTPVNNFLPSSIPVLEKDNQKIELIHLLNHTSSLPRLSDDIDKGWNPDNPYAHYDSTKMYNYLKTYKLTRKPGVLFEYSNLGMGLAGQILERQYGTTYEQIIKNLIAQPLGMTRTKIILTAEDAQNAAKPHDTKGNVLPYWDFKAYAGAGAMRSTAKDMLIYAKKHLDVPTDAIGNAFKNTRQNTYTGKGTDGVDYKIGLAWFELKMENQTVYVHDGGTGGFLSFLFVCPAKNLAMIYLNNNNNEKESPTTAVNLFTALLK